MGRYFFFFWRGGGSLMAHPACRQYFSLYLAVSQREREKEEMTGERTVQTKPRSKTAIRLLPNDPPLGHTVGEFLLQHHVVDYHVTLPLQRQGVHHPSWYRTTFALTHRHKKRGSQGASPPPNNLRGGQHTLCPPPPPIIHPPFPSISVWNRKK